MNPTTPAQRNSPSPRAVLARAIEDAVPELQDPLDGVDPTVDLWAELDLDSMEHVAVIERLAEALRRDIPDRHLPHLLSIDQISAYLTDGPPGNAGAR